MTKKKMDILRIANWAGLTNTSEEFLPKFTKSLDECFKWFIPKLKPKYEVIVESEGIDKFWHVVIFGQAEGCLGNIHTKAKTPALAFCYAIEELTRPKRTVKNKGGHNR